MINIEKGLELDSNTFKSLDLLGIAIFETI